MFHVKHVLAFLMVLSGPVLAQDFPSQIEKLGGGGDSLRLLPLGKGYADLIYMNNGQNTSRNGTYVVAVDGIVVEVSLTVLGSSAGGRERVEVLPRGGYVAVPDVALVPDGEGFKFKIMRAMY